jgi:hypothetical protein
LTNLGYPPGFRQLCLVSSFERSKLTVRRIHVGDVGVVGQLASPQRHSGRAADGRSAVMALVERPLVDEVFLDQGHVV